MADHGLFSCFFGTVKLFWAENQRNASLSGKKAGSVENGINVIEIGGNDSLLQKDFKILCFRVNHILILPYSLLQLDKILLFKKYTSQNTSHQEVYQQLAQVLASGIYSYQGNIIVNFMGSHSLF